MLVQKINFATPIYRRNISFKASENKPPHTKEDIEKTSDLDELYKMLNSFNRVQVNLNMKIEDMEKRCEKAQRQYDYAKSKLHNLKKEKDKLEMERYENEKLFDMAGRKFSALINEEFNEFK